MQNSQERPSQHEADALAKMIREKAELLKRADFATGVQIKEDVTVLRDKLNAIVDPEDDSYALEYALIGEVLRPEKEQPCRGFPGCEKPRSGDSAYSDASHVR